MVRLPFWLGWTSPEKTLPTTGLWGEPAGARPGREIRMGSVSSLVKLYLPPQRTVWSPRCGLEGRVSLPSRRRCGYLDSRAEPSRVQFVTFLLSGRLGNVQEGLFVSCRTCCGRGSPRGGTQRVALGSQRGAACFSFFQVFWGVFSWL